jgi:hypothetical protein
MPTERLGPTETAAGNAERDARGLAERHMRARNTLAEATPRLEMLTRPNEPMPMRRWNRK